MSEAHGLGNQWDAVAQELTSIPLILERNRYAMALKVLLGLDENARILEVGCGAGRILRTLEALGYRHVVGLEISQSRLNYVQQQGQTSAGLICSDHVPFADASFDAVVSAAVIEHVVDPRAWLGELARVVRPGGIISITSDSYMWKWLKRLGMYKTIQPLDEAIWPGKLKRWAHEAGLEVSAYGGFTNVPDQEYYFLKQLKRWASLRRRYYLWRGIRGRQHKPVPAYEYLQEVPGITQALEQQPLSSHRHFWSAIFSYENYFYFRKPACDQSLTTPTPAADRAAGRSAKKYRAAA